LIPDIDAIMGRVLGGPKQPGLVVISTGLGRDSTTIEALMVEGQLPIKGYARCGAFNRTGSLCGCQRGR
jgi:hypothetical protein